MTKRALALLLLLAAVACGRDTAGSQDGGRVLLVGLDGATLRVAGPLLQQGRLPNLARIADEGVHGPLQSFPPLHSPRIWTTIATGKAPEKHGILTFAHPRAYESNALYLSSDRHDSCAVEHRVGCGDRHRRRELVDHLPTRDHRRVMVTD